MLVARGRKTLCFDLKGARPNDDELLELLLGRSGKLRDPAMRVGGNSWSANFSYLPKHKTAPKPKGLGAICVVAIQMKFSSGSGRV